MSDENAKTTEGLTPALEMLPVMASLGARRHLPTAPVKEITPEPASGKATSPARGLGGVGLPGLPPKPGKGRKSKLVVQKTETGVSVDVDDEAAPREAEHMELQEGSAAAHGHSHGGVACGHEHGTPVQSEVKHGHSHGGRPCGHSHGGKPTPMPMPMINPDPPPPPMFLPADLNLPELKQLEQIFSHAPDLKETLEKINLMRRLQEEPEVLSGLLRVVRFPGHLQDFLFHMSCSGAGVAQSTLLEIQLCADKLTQAKLKTPGVIAPPACEELPKSTWRVQVVDEYVKDRNPLLLFYNGHARSFDYLGPWAFVTCAYIACHLMIWWIAILVMIGLVMGTHSTLTAVMRLPGVNPEVSRFMMSVVLALSASGAVEFFTTLLPVVTDYKNLCALEALSFAITPLLHVKTAMADPGFIEKGTYKEGDGRERVCTVCVAHRPLRSKHCHACERCVARFDHHCPVVNNCVGAGNQRWFLMFITSMLIGQICFVIISTLFFYRETSKHDGSRFWAFLSVLEGALHVTFMASIQVVFGMGNAFLVARAVFGAVANLTVNEGMNHFRYKYLSDNRGGYFNPFDRGCCVNCVQFMQAPYNQPDWDELAQLADERGDYNAPKPWLSYGRLLGLQQYLTNKTKGMWQTPRRE